VACLFASLAFALAPPKETKTIPDKIPMMAMTTNNSIKVKPFFINF
jgi:hypothetical protein